MRTVDPEVVTATAVAGCCGASGGRESHWGRRCRECASVADAEGRLSLLAVVEGADEVGEIRVEIAHTVLHDQRNWHTSLARTNYI